MTMRLFPVATYLLLTTVGQVEASIRGVRSRKLQLQLTGFGGEPSSNRFPLQQCQGDCDNDSDCDVGLVCFQRAEPPPGEPWPEVPGCIGGRDFSAKTDFCILAPVEAAEVATTATPTASPSGSPTDSPTAEPTVTLTEGAESTGPTTMTPSMFPTSMSYWDLPELDYVGDDGNLDGLPLGLCQGDCDDDGDCLDDFVCFQRTFEEPIPGCRGEARASMDYCVLPPTKPPEPEATMSPTSGETMAPTMVETAAATEMIVALFTVSDEEDGLPLGLCQGDCDEDVDCLDDMICFQRNYLEPVPGCAGLGRASYDYCILDPNASPATSIPEMTGSPTETVVVVAAVEPPTAEPVVTSAPTAEPVVTSAPTMMLPVLTTVGKGGKDKDTLLGLCEGECKDDDDCEGDLVCLDRDSEDEVPGCSGVPDGGDDYCVDPSTM